MSTEGQTETVTPAEIPSAEENADIKAEVEEVDMDTQDSQIRLEAIHLIGVNELSHKQVQEFAFEYTRKPFAIEWIDDSRLNIVFDDAESADSFLKGISQEGMEETPLEQTRSTKSHPTVACNFQARVANTNDVKSAGAKHESKYYKEHGLPSQQDHRIRFGTGRSEPMKYVRGDILKSTDRIRKSKGSDLFPHLAKDDAPAGDDLFPHLASGGGGDLFPHLVKSGGVSKKGRGNGKRRRNRNSNKSGTNLDAMEIEDVISDKAELKKEGTAPVQTVYSNMDY